MDCLEKIKKDNPFFKDNISLSFENYVIERSIEISGYSEIRLKLFPYASRYIISKSMFTYLSSLTKVNPLDEDIMKKYEPLIREVEEQARIKFENNQNKR
jgi:hypothetical protein